MNEARENLESLIDKICYEYNFYRLRTYRRNARKDYLNFAKCKKRTRKKIRQTLKKQLQYVKRDIGHIDLLLAQEGVTISEKNAARIKVIKELYEQQKYI